MPRRLLRFATVGLLIFAAQFATARPPESVWSALVIANNVAKPEAVSPELGHIEGTLRHLFGYNQFRVIGQASKNLKTGEEDWMASSKFFSLHVDARGNTNGAYLLNLELFQQNKMLLETEAKLSEHSPLVIKGPQVGDGQMLLVLIVR